MVSAVRAAASSPASAKRNPASPPRLARAKAASARRWLRPPSKVSPSPPTAVTAQPLPPLNLSAAPKGGPDDAASGPLAQLLSGIAPIKTAVDGIRSACQQIVQSGAVPGAEQVCAQIIALATSLVPMAAQNLLQPVGGGAPAPGGGMQMPPPPGGPQPIMSPGGPQG